MNEFKNVTVVKKANVYSDGKVTSRTVLFADGTKKTLGIMLTIALIGVPAVLAYSTSIYWIFRGKVKLDKMSY